MSSDFPKSVKRHFSRDATNPVDPFPSDEGERALYQVRANRCILINKKNVVPERSYVLLSEDRASKLSRNMVIPIELDTPKPSVSDLV